MTGVLTVAIASLIQVNGVDDVDDLDTSGLHLLWCMDRMHVSYVER